MVPGRARLEVVATLQGDGCVSAVTEDVFPWGSSDDATPIQHVRVWLDGDSVRIHVEAGDVDRSVARAAPGAVFLLVEDAMGAAAQIVECALSRGDDVALQVVANPAHVSSRFPCAEATAR